MITPIPLNPWKPITEPLDLAHLGKMVEELNECGSASARCQIQGIDEAEPVTGKVNRDWLTEEIADVQAASELAIEHFGLDLDRIAARKAKKKAHLRAWHAMIVEANPMRKLPYVPQPKPEGSPLFIGNGPVVMALILTFVIGLIWMAANP